MPPPWGGPPASPAKLPAVRLHDLRHGAAVMGLEAGLNLELLRRHLGHSRLATTTDLYMRHRAEESERLTVDTLAAMLTTTETAAA